jgi:hypothetical protein
MCFEQHFDQGRLIKLFEITAFCCWLAHDAILPQGYRNAIQVHLSTALENSA